ncbi:unnamed protein product [Discosporangium mesarthrocarpum]
MTKMLKDVGSLAGDGKGGEGGEAVGNAASNLGPMMAKMMGGKVTTKRYDMRLVQSMRRELTVASALMGLTHLRWHKFAVKPMMLQVFFGLLSLVDSPVFKVHVLGMKAEGKLARPFPPYGLSEALKGPLEALAKQAEATQRAREAELAAASGQSGEASATEGVDKEVDEDRGEEEDDEPEVEILRGGGGGRIGGGIGGGSG